MRVTWTLEQIGEVHAECASRAEAEALKLALGMLGHEAEVAGEP